MDSGPASVLRVVLLGKTGAGKSSLGNTLLGRDAFMVSRGMSSGTDKCQWKEKDRNSVSLQVTDTPGLCDTHRSETEVLMEVGKSVSVAAPGPHVVLMVLRCDRRFTNEEYEAYVTLKELFGSDICKYFIIIFVAIDTYEQAPVLAEQRACLQEEVRAASGFLKEVLDDANGRYFGVNNRASREDRETQANELLVLMQDLAKENRNGFYSGELCANVGELVEAKVQSRMRENNTTRTVAERETKLSIVAGNISKEFLAKLLEIVTKALIPVLEKVAQKLFEKVGEKVVEKMEQSGCALM